MVHGPTRLLSGLWTVSHNARRFRRPDVAVEGEDSREAQLVQFLGDCHALLTEWAELPKLNQLIERTSTTVAKLTTVTASQRSAAAATASLRRGCPTIPAGKAAKPMRRRADRQRLGTALASRFSPAR